MDPALVDWCRVHLGREPVRRVFEAGHLSEVHGLELDDGALVVVKIRAPSERLEACAAVQAHLHRQGFPCAAVLVAPTALGDRVASAEAHLDPGDPPPTPPPADASAQLLAELIETTPPASAFPALADPLPWVGWRHGGAGLWPPPDDLDIDLNDQDGTAAFDAAATRVQARLRTTSGSVVIAHMDWEAQNLAWHHGKPVAAHDWDSLGISAESTAVGAAAAVYVSHGAVVFASIDQTERFLAAYVRHRPLTSTELEEAWAAGAWVLAYNAKKEAAGGGTGYLAIAADDLEERLRRAGA